MSAVRQHKQVNEYLRTDFTNQTERFVSDEIQPKTVVRAGLSGTAAVPVRHPDPLPLKHRVGSCITSQVNMTLGTVTCEAKFCIQGPPRI